MADIKEKLVELLDDSTVIFPPDDTVERLADHLIANGVTVQEWISVKERLPEEWKTVLVFKPSIDAIIPAKLRGGSWYTTWDTTRLEYVSHWMPMPEKPQPPKGLKKE